MDCTFLPIGARVRRTRFLHLHKLSKFVSALDELQICATLSGCALYVVLVSCSSIHLIHPVLGLRDEVILQIKLEQDLVTSFSDGDETIQKYFEDYNLGASLFAF